MSPTLQEVAEASGCDYDFINNRVRRNDFTTKLSAAQPGEARNFSRENALEISFLAALNDIGRKPLESRDLVKEWLALEAQGKLPTFYVENRFTNQGITASTAGDNLSIRGLMETLSDDVGSGSLESNGSDFEDPSRPATRIAFIWLGEIVRRIDKLFER